MSKAGRIAVAALFVAIISFAIWFKTSSGEQTVDPVPVDPIPATPPPHPPPRPVNEAALPPTLAAAIEKHWQAANEHRRSGQAWGELGMTYHANGLPELALPCYETAWALAPEEGRWPYFQALILADQGHLPSAIKLMETVTGIREDFNPANIRLALWNLDLNQLERAAYHAQVADRLGAEDVLVIRTMSEIRLKTGAETDVVTILGPIAEANPHDAYSRYLVGMALLKLGRTDDASRMLVGAKPQRPAWGDEWTFELSQRRVRPD